MMESKQDDRVYRPYAIQSVEHGIADAVAGRTTLHQQVAAELRRKWQPKTSEQNG